MQVILMEKVANLGNLGDVVKVKDGFARNYLIPQGKAKRATPENIKHFEGRRAELESRGGYKYPPSQTPWQEIQRGMVDQLADGMVLRPAVHYQRVAQKFIPRDNH